MDCYKSFKGSSYPIATDITMATVTDDWTYFPGEWTALDVLGMVTNL